MSKTGFEELRNCIEEAWQSAEQLTATQVGAVEEVIALLDSGELRVAVPPVNATETEHTPWHVNQWVKQAILLYFRSQGMRPEEVGPFHYHDKIPLKTDYANQGVRVVPPATARYGAYLSSGVILMPSYVNIGARVGEGTLVDTWATVGSCAQIGANVHLSGGVGIGGVLEPVQASPVVVEDDCFIGSRCIVVEGAHIGAGAVLGANVVITSSTHIIDVSGDTPLEHRGWVPPRSVVIPGVREREFPAGRYGVPCALIIGRRNENTDRKTSLNEALRDFQVAV